jgi:hypothetical protein
MEDRIYVYESRETAKKVAKTVRGETGSEARVVGSAVVCNPLSYRETVDRTFAPEAMMVAEEIRQ